LGRIFGFRAPMPAKRRRKQSGPPVEQDGADEKAEEQPRDVAEEAASTSKRRVKGRKAAASKTSDNKEDVEPNEDEDEGDDDADNESSEDEEDDEASDECVEDDEEAEEEGWEEYDEEGKNKGKRIWRPGVDEIGDGEELDAEPGTYDMLHQAQVDWPCLSFDILRDDLGASRTTYPMTVYVVAGSQAEASGDGQLYMMKWRNLCKTAKDGVESDSEESPDSDDEPVLESRSQPHPGGVNRVRSMPQAAHIVASWADTGHVHMWNLEPHRRSLDKQGDRPQKQKQIFSIAEHKQEGFAMDWSGHDTGRFLSGDNAGLIFLWEPMMGGWKVDSGNPFRGHKGSVEDVQWKRTGNDAQYIFASCSSDHTVCVWDARDSSRKPSTTIAAHDNDVNVLSWSPRVGELIATGSDDGDFKVWDVRSATTAMANFKWHKKPITSIDWHPTDEAALAVACDDHCVSLWDMSVEDDLTGLKETPGAEHFPPQLLFLHQGQKEPKEVRWHPQIPSVCICTAASGFNIFKTCNM